MSIMFMSVCVCSWEATATSSNVPTWSASAFGHVQHISNVIKTKHWIYFTINFKYCSNIDRIDVRSMWQKSKKTEQWIWKNEKINIKSAKNLPFCINGFGCMYPSQHHNLDSIAVSLFGNMTIEPGEIHIITKEWDGCRDPSGKGCKTFEGPQISDKWTKLPFVDRLALLCM